MFGGWPQCWLAAPASWSLRGALRAGWGRAGNRAGHLTLGEDQQTDKQKDERDQRHIEDDGIHRYMPPRDRVVAGFISIGEP